LPDSSTKGREKRWTLNHPQSVLTNVLHPSVELTALCGRLHQIVPAKGEKRTGKF